MPVETGGRNASQLKAISELCRINCPLRRVSLEPSVLTHLGGQSLDFLTRGLSIKPVATAEWRDGTVCR